MTSPTSDRRQGLVGNTPYKAPVTVASIVNVLQSGEQTIDGVALRAVNAAGYPDRVLCTAQSDPTKNGIWDVSTATWTRSVDADGSFDLARGTQVLVNQGTIGAQQIWFLSTPNPILIGATSLSWTLLTVAAAAYPGQPTVIVGDGVTDRSAAIQAANALGRPMLFFGIAVVGTPTTITVPIVDTIAQIFSTASQVTIANNLPVRPEWWGIGNQNIVDIAITALPTTGGVVQLEDQTYLTSNYAYGFAGAGKNISKDNVKIIGRKMPTLASDCKSLTGGTILQGMVTVFANNFEISDLGVDVGFTFVQNFLGGVATAGFCDGLTLSYPNDAVKAAATVKQRAVVRNVIALCKAPGTLSHATLFEGYKNVSLQGEIIGVYGVHGCAIKSLNVTAERITTYCNDFDGLIVKSDSQASSIAGDVQVGRVYNNAGGPPGLAPYVVSTAAGAVGTLIQAAGNSVSRVEIGQVMAFGYPIGVGTSYGGVYVIDDVSIDSIITDQQGVAGTNIGVQIYAPSGEVDRFRIGSVTARNTTVGLQAIFNQGATSADHLHVDRLEVVNATSALELGNTAYVSVNTVIAANCSAGVFHILGTPRLSVGMVFKDTATTSFYSSAAGAVIPSFANGWTQVAANDPFNVDLSGGRINLRGLIKPGTTNVASVLPQWAWPSTNKRFMVQGYNGTTVVSVPLVVDTAGNVKVNEIAGGFANCSTWLSLSGVSFDQQA